jgi:RNA polymerase sigma-70 factor (ECF subfamily)
MSSNVARSRPNLRLVPSGAPEGASAPPPAAAAFDDSELLTAVRAGDTSAAAAFHDRVRPQVDRTVRRLLGASDPDREDIVQNAMIDLVTTIDRFRGDCSLDSWTSTIAARRVYKHIRRRKFERRLFGATGPEDLAEVISPLRGPRDAILRNLTQRVRAHLDAIDENKAWAFVLHDVCGYDLREIAEITGVGVAAAQSRLVRGRREIHERIAADPELAGAMRSLEGES